VPGSPDPVWRDDIGYGVVVSCVSQKKLLDAGQRREIIATLADDLRRGIGEAGTDTVLLRSFSARDPTVHARRGRAAGFRPDVGDAPPRFRPSQPRPDPSLSTTDAVIPDLR
jgi:hypothetical protein